MVALQPDPFLNELGKLFERNKASGSLFITMKRTNMKPRNSKKVDTAAEYTCLVRATDGKKKIATEIGVKEQGRFQTSYATILKAHMDALKRKERTKRPASKK
ncbi:RNA-binding signal recognition particle subunit srp14 [Trebouxia sp. C0010 RCD-2024]